MSATPELQRRISELRSKLERAISHHKRRAIGDHWLTIFLMAIALLSSAPAGLGGIFFGLSAKATGGIALIPGLSGLAASTFRFQGKSHWHYRKRDALEALLNRLTLELPETPSADNIASISSSLAKITQEFQRNWEKEFTVTWTSFKRP